MANNPEAATHEDLTKLATHAHENAPDVLQSTVDQNFGGDTNTDEFNIDNRDDDASASRSVETSTDEDSSDDDSSNDDSDNKQR